MSSVANRPTSRKRAKQQSDGTRPSLSRFFSQGDTTLGRPSERRTSRRMTLNQDANGRPSLDPCGPDERCHGTTRKRRAQVGGSDQGASRTLNSAYRQAINTPRFSFGSFGAVHEPKQDGLKSILLRLIFGAQLAFLKQMRLKSFTAGAPRGVAPRNASYAPIPLPLPSSCWEQDRPWSSIFSKPFLRSFL